MENRFDYDKYMNLLKKNNGNFEIISYPQLSCPISHPIHLGYLDNFDNGQLNFCGKVCKNF